MIGYQQFWEHAKLCQGNLVKKQQCEFSLLQNPFKTAKLVERFCKKWQNNPSGNSHILLNKTQTNTHGVAIGGAQYAQARCYPKKGE